MNPVESKRHSSGIVGLLFAAGLLGLMIFGWMQRQAIYDWARLREYVPPPEIAQLAADTTMNDDARHLFYVYHPELNDRAQFSSNCGNTGEQTIVLGCYVSNLGIYLFDVDDPRLQGVEQVTAAHEMLHVAYERLSQDERAEVDKMTETALSSLNDERIKKTVENYRRRDPSIVPNELHSILGTEVRELSPELEKYYKKYFTNRAQIVAFSEKYETVLTERRNKAATLEVQLTGLKAEIELQEKTLNELQDGLKRDRSSVDTQEEVVAYNQRVQSYNSNIRHLNSLIEQYNSLVEEYKKNVVEAQELFKALDSRPTL
jgi:hypothetical protein